MKAPKTIRFQSAFTLVEMLVTISIMILMAGLVVGSMGYVQDKQARSKAKVQIRRLAAAIENYRTDMGAYPGEPTGTDTGQFFGGVDASTDPEGRFSSLLYNALFHDGYQFAEEITQGNEDGVTDTIYLGELDPRGNKQGWIDDPTTTDVPRGLLIVDPWGNEYRYRVGDNAQNPDFDLWSAGKDGETNSADSASALNDPVNRDDERNF